MYKRQKEDTYDFHLENTLDMKVLMKKFKLSSKNAQSVTLEDVYKRQV